MPFGDGTGPYGKGAKTGRGMNENCGQGKPAANKSGAGPAGKCICPSCGYSQQHSAGKPCNSVNCPKCGATMSRG